MALMTMDRKQGLYSGTMPTRKPQGSASTPAKMLTIGVVCLFALLHFSWRISHWSVPHLQPCDSHDHTFTYPGEKIAWRACGELSNRTLECANLTVPMDHFDAVNSGDKTFLVPLIRLRGRNATQNVLFNPGGPGGSGVEAVFRMGDRLHAMIGEGFHLISFDPRGIGSSLPTVSCYPDGHEGLKSSLMQPLIHQGARAADMGELVAGISNYVQACVDTMGEHGSYINTPQTAADMNSILDAVGQDDMLYYGTSYGTVLGQTYAAMFPERSKRVIIDGVVNIFQWYSDIVFFESLADTQKLFESMLEECVRAGPKNCTLASAAPSASQLMDKISDTVDRLRDQPLSVYLDSTHYGLITAETVLFTAVFTSLYRPSLWPGLVDAMSQLLAGNGTEFLLKYGLTQGSSDMTGFNFVVGNDGRSGPKNWEQGPAAMQRVLNGLVNSTLVGTAQNSWYLSKQQWLYPKTHNFTISPPGTDGYSSIKTAHPMLILSTTYDPVTPLRSARAANSVFEGSQIVEVKGYGHCSLAEPSRCLVRKFRDYLYEGKLPSGYTTCEVDLPYFPRDDNRDKIRPSLVEIQDEEERAYEGQAALAREWDGYLF